jgi:hypothetical protein
MSLAELLAILLIGPSTPEDRFARTMRHNLLLEALYPEHPAQFAIGRR